MTNTLVPSCLIGMPAPWGDLNQSDLADAAYSIDNATLRTTAVDACDRTLTALAEIPRVSLDEFPAWVARPDWGKGVPYATLMPRFEAIRLGPILDDLRSEDSAFPVALAQMFATRFVHASAGNVFATASNWLHAHLEAYPNATTFAALRTVVEKHVGDRTWKVQHLITTLHRFDHANTLPWLCTLATSPQLSPDVLRAVAYKLAAEKTRPDLVAQGAAILAALPSDEDDSDEDA